MARFTQAHQNRSFLSESENRVLQSRFYRARKTRSFRSLCIFTIKYEIWSNTCILARTSGVSVLKHLFTTLCFFEVHWLSNWRGFITLWQLVWLRVYLYWSVHSSLLVETAFFLSLLFNNLSLNKEILTEFIENLLWTNLIFLAALYMYLHSEWQSWSKQDICPETISREAGVDLSLSNLASQNSCVFFPGIA